MGLLERLSTFVRPNRPANPEANRSLRPAEPIKEAGKDVRAPLRLRVTDSALHARDKTASFKASLAKQWETLNGTPPGKFWGQAFSGASSEFTAANFKAHPNFLEAFNRALPGIENRVYGYEVEHGDDSRLLLIKQDPYQPPKQRIQVEVFTKAGEPAGYGHYDHADKTLTWGAENALPPPAPRPAPFAPPAPAPAPQAAPRPAAAQPAPVPVAARVETAPMSDSRSIWEEAQRRSASVPPPAAAPVAAAEPVVVRPEPKLWNSVTPETPAGPPEARALATALRTPALEAQATAALDGAPSADARAALASNLASFASLSSQATSAFDYAQSGSGPRYPMRREDYRRLQASGPQSPRQEQSRRSLSAQLEEALQGEPQGVSGRVDAALVKNFVGEIGLRPEEVKDWKITPEAVRRATADEALAPLRSLNENLGPSRPMMAWAGSGHYAPSDKAALAEVAHGVIRHVLEGDFETWRMRRPEAEEQLSIVSPEKRETWAAPMEIKDGPLTTREEKGNGLLWVTKIGGPSYGFDYGPQSLLSILGNPRMTPIVANLEGQRDPVLRAGLRLIQTAAGKPMLFLDEPQFDFAFGGNRVAAAKAVVKHALAKAKAMDLPLGVHPGTLAFNPAEIGAVGQPSTDQFVLTPSAARVEATTTFGRHDWMQMDRWTSPPVRYVAVKSLG